MTQYAIERDTNPFYGWYVVDTERNEIVGPEYETRAYAEAALSELREEERAEKWRERFSQQGTLRGE